MLFVYYAILLLLVIGFVVLILAFFFTLLYLLPMVKGAVYVPSKPEAIAAMIKLGGIKPGMKVADLGSGDGRIVVELAKAGAIAHGYEVNPLLILRANRNIMRAKVSKKTKIIAKSYWDVDLSNYDVIVVYGITYIMKDLEEKLQDELRPGAKVLSNYFTFPRWKKSKTLSGVHLYRQTL